MGGLPASIPTGIDMADGMRQSSRVMVKEERAWTGTEVRGRSGLRELVGVHAGGDTIASEVWAIGGSDCDMIGEADEDGDLFLGGRDDYRGTSSRPSNLG